MIARCRCCSPLAAMRVHAGSAAVQTAACEVLRNIAQGSDARARAVVGAGALPEIIAAIRGHAGRAAVQARGALAHEGRTTMDPKRWLLKQISIVVDAARAPTPSSRRSWARTWPH